MNSQKARNIADSKAWQQSVIGTSGYPTALTVKELFLLVCDLDQKILQAVDNQERAGLTAKRGYWSHKYHERLDRLRAENKSKPVAQGESWSPARTEDAPAPSLPTATGRRVYAIVMAVIVTWLLVALLIHGCRSSHVIADETQGGAIAGQGMSGQGVCGYNTLQGRTAGNTVYVRCMYGVWGYPARYLLAVLPAGANVTFRHIPRLFFWNTPQRQELEV